MQLAGEYLSGLGDPGVPTKRLSVPTDTIQAWVIGADAGWLVLGWMLKKWPVVIILPEATGQRIGE
jgi:S-adenosylmethionine hydrolase